MHAMSSDMKLLFNEARFFTYIYSDDKLFLFFTKQQQNINPLKSIYIIYWR